MPKTYIFILAAALLATACTPTRPTAQARVALPWSAQQLTDSLKYLLAHVVRMDTAQYHVADGVFSMRPGATVHDLTVVGKLNVLAEPGNGLPDTIHLPHDSIPHLPGGGVVGESASRRIALLPNWWGDFGPSYDTSQNYFQDGKTLLTPGWTNFDAITPGPSSLIDGGVGVDVDPGMGWGITPDGKITPPAWLMDTTSWLHTGAGVNARIQDDSLYISTESLNPWDDVDPTSLRGVHINPGRGKVDSNIYRMRLMMGDEDTSVWRIGKIELRKDIPNFVAAAPVVTYTRVRPPTKKTKRHAKH